MTDLTQRSPMQAATLMRTHVAPHHGVPTVFIDDEPRNVLGFWHTHVDRAEPDIANFAEAGVHVFTCGVGVGSTIDALMERLLAVNPNVLLLPRVGLYEGAEWRRAHPDDVMAHRDLAGQAVDPAAHRRAAFTSEAWRADMSDRLAQLIRHCEAKWSRHVLGYHLAAGATGEWSYAWGPMMSDFSPAQHTAFRAWLRDRYHDEVAALRAAWRDEQVTFDTAAIPTDRTAPGWNTPSIFDPATDRRQIDYATFHSFAVADAIRHFAGVAKRTLREVGTDKLVGVFYGYHLLSSGPFHNNGHHALHHVLTCPDVDFICSPQTYHLRQPGGMFDSKLPLGSLRLHGKLYYNEDDTFTFLAKRTPWRYCATDLETTIRLLRRNFAGMWTAGGQQWWMDHDGDGWYRDDGLMAEVAAQRQLADTLRTSDRSPVAEIAVMISEGSAPFIRHDDRPIHALLTRQIEEISAIGAPYETFDVADVERLFGSPEGDRFRFVVFLDAIHLTPNQRRAIREHVARGGRTLLWLWAAGLATETGLSTEAMGELTGMPVRFGEAAHAVRPPLVEAYLTGTRVVYGSDEPIGPTLLADLDAEPDAETLGWSLLPHGPGLVRRWHGTGAQRWCSIWSAAPNLPATLLRPLARDAGVHLFSDAGDQVFANASMLALHARRPGPRTIHLPQSTTLTDAFTGQTVARQATHFDLTLQRGQTAIWLRQ